MRKINRNSLLFSVLSLVVIILLCGILCFNKSEITIAKADTQIYYSDADYTDSDYLLLDNGSESLTRKITHFASDVKAASSGTSFPELAQVIPRQYLETSTTNDEFYYNGKELIIVV